MLGVPKVSIISDLEAYLKYKSSLLSVMRATYFFDFLYFAGLLLAVLAPTQCLFNSTVSYTLSNTDVDHELNGTKFM